MRRQDREIVHRGIVEGELVDIHRECLVVPPLDPDDAAKELGIGDAGRRVLADGVAEEHVLGRHRHAVAPGRVGPQPVGQAHAVLAAGQLELLREPVLEARQLHAQHADEMPVRVIGGERPLHHRQHIALRRHRIDRGVERRWILGDADRKLVGRARGRRPGRGRAKQQQEKRRPPHRGPSIARGLPPASRQWRVSRSPRRSGSNAGRVSP